MKDWQNLNDTLRDARNADMPVCRHLLLEAKDIIQRMIDRIDEELIRAGRMTDEDSSEYRPGDRLYLRSTDRAVVIDDVRVNSVGQKQYKPIGMSMYFPASFFERAPQKSGQSLLEGDGC